MEEETVEKGCWKVLQTKKADCLCKAAGWNGKGYSDTEESEEAVEGRESEDGMIGEEGWGVQFMTEGSYLL